MSRRRHHHPGGQGNGSTSPRGIPHYGIVKGTALRQMVFPPAGPRSQPHLHILVSGGGDFDVAVDVFSQEHSEVRFVVVPDFTPPNAQGLLDLDPGATEVGSGNPDGLGLDYIRQGLVNESVLQLLPFDPENLENDLHNGLGDLVAQAIAARAEIYAFGSLFDDSGGRRGPNPFNIDPVRGIHDIHMNQGNPPDSHFQDNGTFQDGALFVHLTGDRERWVAVFIAFQSQSFTTDDAGAPTAPPKPRLAATRLVPAQRRPGVTTSPAVFQLPIDPARRAHVLANLQKIPPPRIDPPVFALGDVIGEAAVREISASGQIVIHTVGDSGRGTHSAQGEVAEAMTRDFQKPNPADHPALFFHLGDVIYGHDKDALYRELFYSPYDIYPGQIVAIPGNHDGEVIPRTDPKSLAAFLANFCDTERQHPEIAGTAPRLTMNQPGVYFRLDAPFVRLIGLYSNVAENSGFITIPGTGGDAQKNFLVSQLKAIGQLRAQGDTAALAIAMHHPPYSGGGHAGSSDMLADIDDAVQQAGVAPDIVLSGHAHNYQRFTRKFFLDGAAREIPYFVAGGGGRGITPIRLPASGGPIAGATGDHSLRQFYNGFGYMTLTITSRVLTADFFGVSGQDTLPLDTITLDLRTHKITHEQPPFTHPAPGEASGHRRAFDG
jgi:uncharacterized protein YukJ/predicted phosphodiesterase